MSDKELELGVQPLDAIMDELELKNHDLVEASTDGLTHKQVNKGRKGRRLSRNIQNKIVVSIPRITGNEYNRSDLILMLALTSQNCEAFSRYYLCELLLD